MSGVLQAIDSFRLVGLTALDLFVIVVVGLSALLAMFRGMSREAFTLAAWLGAAVCAWLAWPQVAPLLEPYIADELLRMVAAIVVAFVVPLVVFLIIAGILANLIENSFLAPVDRGLGIVFGILRGGVLVLVTYLVLLFAFPQQPPSWIQEAKVQPVLDQGLGVARTFLADRLPVPESGGPPAEPIAPVDDALPTE